MRAVTVMLTALLVACAGSPDSNECKSGITCPEGTKCAAAQAICINNDCGDGVVQGNEKCDDGNILDGDGCAGNCASNEACGDGVLNAAAGELCDDSNTVGGDGCAADCRSIEICGNGIRDVNEACDDGNTVPGDGCSGNCRSTEICGNKIVDLGEKCDDGDEPGGCNPDCQGGTGCGDGAIDIDGSGNPLEECDDGNGDNFDDCTDDCHLNACGDGIVQTSGSRTEQCDGTGVVGTPGIGGETASCNIDCTTTSCGDNKINNAAGEECDDGTISGVNQNSDDRDCTSECHVARCGDLKINTVGPTLALKETCDDGNAIPTDSCSTTCKPAACGNGIREGAEACDDGNLANNDGCSSTCTNERCGDGIKNDGEDCDGGGETPTCNVDCTQPPDGIMCGDGKINKAAGEQCDDQNTNDAGDQCRNNCKLNVCGDGSQSDTELCDDGDDDNLDGCTTGCTTPTCGDGIIQGVEQCDDGNDIDTDSCRDCMLATCGDGFVQAGVEDCDSNIGPQNNCTPECKFNVCGDGFRDQEDNGPNDDKETCDDGNLLDESNCLYGTATCNLCNHDCTQNENNLTGNVCGDGVEVLPEVCDDGNRITEANCPYGAPNGMCMACDSSCLNEVARTGPWCGDGTAQMANGEACDDRSPTQSCGRCSNNCGQVITAGNATQATGVIFTTDNMGNNISDDDNIVLRDGKMSVTLEFNEDMTSPEIAGSIVIDATTSLSATQVRDKIAQAIVTAQGMGLHIETVNISTNGLLLRNLRASAIGNQAITKNGFTSAFFVSPAMTGGLAGDCPAATPCTNNQDCLAANTGVGTCTNNLCVEN